MPLYEYRCGGCGAVFGRVRAVVERRLPATCDGCGGAGRAIYSPPTIGLASFGRNIWPNTPGRTAKRPYGWHDEQRLKAEGRGG